MIIVEKIVDLETKTEEIIEREATKQEIAEIQKVQKEIEEAIAEASAKEAARLEVLEKLGLTADEAAVLLS